MHSSIRRIVPFLLAAAALLSSSCAQRPQERAGFARVMASTAGTVITIDHVKVSIWDNAIPAHLITAHNLVLADGVYQLTFSDLAVGTYAFKADAFSGSDETTAAFSGQAPSVGITANQTALVEIVLHSNTAPIDVATPSIDAVTASTQSPREGAAVGLTSAASGGTGTLSYTWSATAGSFSDLSAVLTANSANATWYAPHTLGPQSLTIRVTDAGGNSAALTITLDVITDAGSAEVFVFLPPQLNFLSAAQSAANQAVWQISLQATPPPDGDTLAYSWVTDSNCPSGSAFSDASTRQPAFTFSAPGTCILTVTITDPNPALTPGNYPFVTAHLTVSDKATVAEFGPAIESGTQSQSKAVGNDVVTFEVSAQDGNSPAQILTYAWTATDGTPGETTDAPAFSWTAPACIALNGSAISVTVQNTGGLTATMTFTVLPASGACIVVPTPSGTFDTSFGSGGFLPAGQVSWQTSNATQMNVDAANKVVVTGNVQISGSYGFAILRLDPTTGALDPTFGNGGIVLSSGAQVDTDWYNAIDSLGRIIVGGSAPLGQSRFFIARYNANGSPDSTFGGGSGSVTSNSLGVGALIGIVVAPDRTIYAVGRTFVSGAQYSTVAHYLEDGTLDPAFGTGGAVLKLWGTGPGTSSEGDAIALQQDGKVVVGGTFTASFGSGRFHIVARYNADGTADGSFGTAGVTQIPASNGGVVTRKALRLQSDGRIVMAVQGTIMRLNPDGTLDQAFGTGGTEPIPGLGFANDMIIESDGKLIAAGYTGANLPTFVRMNPNGSPDPTFATGGILTSPNSMGGAGVQAIALSGANLYAAGAGFVIARVR